MNRPRPHLIRLALLVSFLLLGSAACQQSSDGDAPYPDRPITYLVPWNPGGGTDTASRAMAAVLQQHVGTPVTVVNRTGGGGVVGHLALAQAEPDGYVLGAVTTEIAIMHWMGLTDLTHEDYTPLALLTNNPAAVSVRADAPWDTLDELIAAIEADPGALQASGTSRGGIWDLARIGMLRAAGLPANALPWVPSQGAAPAFQELLAGGVDVVTAALAEADALLQAGQVKVLGVMAEERLDRWPDVPTLKEQGLDWSVGGWVTVSAPDGLPQAVQDTLVTAIRAASQDEQFRQPMQNAGFNVDVVTGDSLHAFLAEQDDTMGELLTSAGIAQQ